MRRSTVSLAAVALMSVVSLTACGSMVESSSPVDGNQAVVSEGERGMLPQPADGVGADVAASESMMVEGGAPSTVQAAQQDRSVIRSASGLVSVENLDESHKKLNSIVLSEGGTVLSEYVKSGFQTPPPVYYDSYGGASMPYYGYDYEQYVDVIFTVPEDNYAQTIEQVRSLGEVVSLNQTATDVTTQVVDVDARISAARASVERIEALLGEAQNLDEMLRLEQELTMRQGNLDSLLAQQASLASQVSQSTVSVRLVPSDLLESTEVPVYHDPTLWDRTVDALASAWTGLVVFIAFTSPIWIIGGIIVLIVLLLVRRNRRNKKSVAAAPVESADV